ncbi:MAG: hypothetical protein HY907_11785 [Deltaproteobacteria bacterium]|nr:hypothetical protein [Deltaproteobacteria bacterium]
MTLSCSVTSLTLAAVVCAAACPSSGPSPVVPATPPGEPAPIPIGDGDLDAFAARESEVALCLHGAGPRLLLVALPAGPATDLAWPLGPDDRCQRLAVGDDAVCIASYDGGVACAPRDGGPDVVSVAVAGPPTGLAWDGASFWAATDGEGLWRFTSSGDAERVLDLPDVMSGLVAGPFGLAWGSAGEFTWRTRTLRRGAGDPTWIRPPLPVNVRCEDEAEVCEWVSTAIGWFRGKVWFAAANAPAPLYTWNPDEGQWREYHVDGEVLVGPAGAWAVSVGGAVQRCPANRNRFEPAGVALDPGEALGAAAGGLWAAGHGVLRLVVAAP